MPPHLCSCSILFQEFSPSHICLASRHLLTFHMSLLFELLMTIPGSSDHFLLVATHYNDISYTVAVYVSDSLYQITTSWEQNYYFSNSDFIFLGSKITADGDCGHEIKRCLSLGRRAMTNLDILKIRDITLLTNVHLVKAMVFPVIMYGCESWTIKKAEHWRIDAFELWCWRRLLRVPWTARRYN